MRSQLHKLDPQCAGLTTCSTPWLGFVCINVLTIHLYTLLQTNYHLEYIIKNVTGPAKTGHIFTKYTCLKIVLFLVSAYDIHVL